MLKVKEIYVRWVNSNENNFIDNYNDVLYGDALNDHYNDYFKTKYDFKYNMLVMSTITCIDCNKGKMTFDEYLNVIKNSDIIVYINTRII